MAVIEQEQDQGTITFISVRRGLRLVRKPKRILRDAEGMRAGVSEGVTYEFEPEGMLVVSEGQDVLPDGPGNEEQDVVAWLRGHPLFQSQSDGFHEVGAEPDRIPDAGPTVAEITEAAIEGDDGEIREILRVEENGWQREAVLTAGRAALARLGAKADAGDAG